MKRKLLLMLTFIGAFYSTKAQTYYAISPTSDSLYTIDRATGTSVNEYAIKYNNGIYNGLTGIAQNPITDEIYVLVKKQGTTSELAMFNTAKDSLILIDTLVDKFAGITFDSNGVLYGITGDGASQAATLFTINTLDASSNLLIDLSATTDDGESIEFNPNDGLIYRFTGFDTLQTINPLTLSTINYAFSHTTANWGQALYFNANSNQMILVAGDSIYDLNSTGELSNSVYTGLGNGYSIKGLLLKDFSGLNQINNINLMAFPNPVNVLVNIESDRLIHQIKIYNTNGQIVKTINKVNMKQLTVDTVDLEKGIYFVEITTINNDKKTIKIIK